MNEIGALRNRWVVCRLRWNGIESQ